jgi:hypothetical protein
MNLECVVARLREYQLPVKQDLLVKIARKSSQAAQIICYETKQTSSILQKYRFVYEENPR